jgi:hypothetical protein
MRMNENDTSDRLLDRCEVESRFCIPKRFLEVAAVRGDGPPMVKIGRLARLRIPEHPIAGSDGIRSPIPGYPNTPACRR